MPRPSDKVQKPVAASVQPLTRGVAVKPLVTFVRQRGGPQAWDRILAQLPEGEREMFARPIATTALYPTTAMINLLRLTVKELLDSNTERTTEIGAFFLDEIMNSIYRTFLRLGPIPLMIRKMPILFERFHNAGSLTPFDLEKQSARARLEHPLLDIVFCRTVAGILIRAFALLGVKDLVFTHERCVAKGDECCVFRARWK